MPYGLIWLRWPRIMVSWRKWRFFWIDAMREILAAVRTRAGTGRLYFFGSSMGGYGSLVHGHLLHAAAVYANVPQTWLLGSSYSDGGVKKFLSHFLEILIQSLMISRNFSKREQGRNIFMFQSA